MKVSVVEQDMRAVRMMLPWIMVGLLLAAGGALAVEPLQGEETPGGNSFLATEFRILGSSNSTIWSGRSTASFAGLQQIGGDDIGGSAAPEVTEEKVEGPSNTGDKVKAGLLSAVLPGAGQFYNGQKKKAYIMGGIEVAIWTAYFVFDAQGDSRRESAREYAAIYAGTSGEHEESYWQNVGFFMDSDAFNESLLREARALNEPVGPLVGGSDTWQWVNQDRRNGYSQLRADGNAAYDRRDFMILFAVVNRAVSVVDAVLGAGKNDDSLLGTEVMGMNLELEMLPSFRNPGARCVVSRSF